MCQLCQQSADCSPLLCNHRYNNGYFLALAALIVDIVAINKNMTPHWLRRIVTVMITPRTRSSTSHQPPAAQSFKHHSGVDCGSGCWIWIRAASEKGPTLPLPHYTIWLSTHPHLRYIEWKGVKIHDFQKVTFSTLFKLYIVGLGVLITERCHMLG